MCGGLNQLLSMSVIDLGAGKIADLSSATMSGSLHALLCFPCCSPSQSLSHLSSERCHIQQRQGKATRHLQACSWEHIGLVFIQSR